VLKLQLNLVFFLSIYILLELLTKVNFVAKLIVTPTSITYF